MKLNDFVRLAERDETVYITDVEKAFNELDEKTEIYMVMDLIEKGQQKEFDFSLPQESLDNQLVKDYFYGKIYNIISTLGGRKLTIYYDKSNSGVQNLVGSLEDVFGVNESKKMRKGYARGINVADRMNEVLCGETFSFAFEDLTRKPKSVLKPKIKSPNLKYLDTVKGLSGLMCGIDIGGTDIKIAVSCDDEIICFKEFDWYPASYKTIEEIIDPVLLLVEVLRIKATHYQIGGNEMMSKLLDIALDKQALLEDIEKCTAFGNSLYKDKIVYFDGIGMCFPDVVVKNRIVGGEVSKVKSVRENPDLDFEKEFKKLSALNDLLAKHCKKDGVVKMTNDGPMASYTAAIELAYAKGEDVVKDGVFAHTLGTELGTGWVDEQGEIPETPMEAYNYVVDLGSYEQRRYFSDDLRSINNFNTEIPGTVQKSASQYGAFRLAIKYFKQERQDLYKEMVDKGFVVEQNGGLYVPTEPVDLRKPFLNHVMSLPEREKTCEVCNRIFREIGESVAIIWLESEQILEPVAKQRVLFGRVVKNKRCFELMCEGAKKIVPDLKLSVADGDMAYTPLMKQLKESKEYTVAQFAQAVGAIYFAMSDKI